MEQLSLVPPEPAPPGRSNDQRRKALEKANSIRFTRAALWTRWRNLYLSQGGPGVRLAAQEASAIIQAPPDWALSWKISAFLIRIPMWGKTRTSRLLALTHISPSRSLGALTPRQRQELCRELERFIENRGQQ